VDDFVQSGCVWLTGRPEGPPLLVDAPLGARLRTLTDRIAAASGVALDLPKALGGRAALAGWTRSGAVSANGSCRLLPAADGGWVAVNLARSEDLEVLPALLRAELSGDPWAALAAVARTRAADAVASEAQTLGIPAAALTAPVPRAVGVSPLGARAAPRPLRELLVVDLSSLWAGPLCAHVLRCGGATVEKVESAGRPDRTRDLSPVWHSWLHGGSRPRVVDLRGAEVRELIARADVVIEASRPRALEALGLGPHQAPSRPGRVWVSITGYGRRHGMKIAFGDDAAAGGGLVAFDAAGPVFCGDALADPLSGLVAADAVLSALAAGGGVLLDVAMHDVAATFAASDTWGRPSRPHRLAPPPVYR
jgi:hypothetical protein